VDLNNVDLYQDPPPFFDYPAFRTIWAPVLTPGYTPTKAEKNAIAYAARHAEMFNRADVLVLTLPMWNFGIPAIMKAWMDQVIAPTLTFVYEAAENGSTALKPLHHVRKIILLVASGGVYREGDRRDALTIGIEAAFGFIGIEDVTIAWADGQNAMAFPDHAERRQTALEAAQEAAEEIAAEAITADVSG
jgi:FMN-dependent NADH-azoreductase